MQETGIDLGLVPFKEGCKALRSSETKVNRLIARGEIEPPLRIGASRYWLESQLRAAVAAAAARAAKREESRRLRRGRTGNASPSHP